MVGIRMGLGLFALLWLAAAGTIGQGNDEGGDRGYWPSFRGPDASGILEEQDLPLEWDGDSGRNIAWKREIPGLAHSSPIVWGNRLFLTTAVNLEAQASYKHGLYGAGTAADDVSQVHRWQVYCLDARSGRTIWVRTAYEGTPDFKRHIKSTYASSSPATDGRRVAAFFGSQGLYVYDMDGDLLWSKNLG
ncbi:MAG TPA: PQQ-binding-like beta-propeller repeat protein, partial [Acidobacteriota bacterium]|nr:PQQ-binding-like beta-propeller repeat protein [Acidobacteriota bacterium]